MEREFKVRVAETLAKIDSRVLDHHEDEFWMIRASYEYLEYYANRNELFNTALALPLARGLHSGTYRKLPIVRSGIPHQPPYVIHCLTVCKMLADLWLPISDEDRDILLASALCHDMIEDIDFPCEGRELVTDYFLDERVYETVKLLSKRSDFTPDQEKEYFRGIMENRLALLIKFSDRGHNVTDLYNMSDKKIKEYIGETRTFFLPMCEYARENYPELNDVTEIMQDQMICLTKTVEKMRKKLDGIRDAQSRRLRQLKDENAMLRAKLREVRGIS